MKHQALTLLWITLYTFLFAPLAPLWAQVVFPVADGGSAPPQIQHQPLEKATAAGEPMEIEAVIHSTVPVQEAVVLYRRIGASGSPFSGKSLLQYRLSR